MGNFRFGKQLFLPMKTPYLPLWAGLSALALCGHATALSTGDLAFTGFRSDGPDELAFVALVAIPGNETIHLTNNSWNGEAIGSPSAGFIGAGGYLTWTAPTAGVPAGTVVTLSALDGASAATSLGSLIRSGNFNISATADLIYAYQGPDRFTVDAFLGAVGNTTQDNLTNTGLTAGSTAILLVDAGNDDAPYVLADYGGDRGSENLFAAYLPLLGNPGNWNLYEPAQFTGFDTSSFTVAEDLTGPVITLLEPDDDSSDVPVGISFEVTFDENVFHGSGSVFIHQTSEPRTTVEIPVAATTISGSTVTISPGLPLNPESHYRIEVPAGAYQDAVGNPFDGLTHPAAWNFTTAVADTTAPGSDYYVLTPANGTGGVSPKANLVVEFDEPVQKGTGVISIHRGNDDALVEAVPVGSGAVTITDRYLTINPVTTLAPGTGYYVLVGETAVKDLSGNLFEGISGKTTWSFTTTALRAGSIAFTGFNADAADALAFVALTPVSGGATIVFTDNGWNGGETGAGGAFGVGEGQVVWTAPTGGVPAGTVVTLNQINVGGISASTGSVRGSIDLDSFNESVYAFAGSDTSPVFLAFVSTQAGGSPNGDSLEGTGLTEGTTAIRLTPGTDIAAYHGPRGGEATFDAYLPLLGNVANWQHQDTLFIPGSDPPQLYDDSTDGIAPDVPFDTAQFTLVSGNTFATWIGGHDVNGLTGFGDDPDADGLPNGVENYLGGKPDQPGAGLYQVSRSGSSLVFRHTRNNTVAEDVSGAYEWSSNLQAWQVSGAANAGGTVVNFGAPVTLEDNAAPVPDVIEVTATVSGAAAPRIFVRLAAILGQ